MRPLLLSLVIVSGLAYAQKIVAPEKIPRKIKEIVDQPQVKQSLACEVHAIKPALNFGFRFQSGYVARVPLQQYRGPGHLWAVVAKVTPEGGDRRPAYLVNVVNLPNVTETKQLAELGGGYLLGEGRYAIEWTLVDDSSRVCRKNWSVDVALQRSERKVRPAMAPYTVSEIALPRSADMKPEKAGVQPLRVSVLLHAAPLFPRRTRLRSSDILMLLGSLSALLERLPVKSVRLGVFNLDQQAEIFRSDAFAPDSLDQAADSLNRLELGHVDYKVLEKPRGNVELLVHLVNRELTAETPSDIVLFMGPMSRYADKAAPSVLETQHGRMPHFFYFEFKPYFRRDANFPDSVALMVSRLKGKTMVIHTPGEFAKAIAQVETRADSR
ncbi:MAG TPA: hypothetical protein VMZ52_14620 [Bryobacteraceae bacterium]|nr:hypothetical protein [Bryobacteraceae bacterium]